MRIEYIDPLTLITGYRSLDEDSPERTCLDRARRLEGLAECFTDQVLGRG